MTSDKTINGKPVIVKYENRKLYNRETATYVTLPDLLALGVDNFYVFNHKTGVDITAEVVLASLFNHFKDNPLKLVKLIKDSAENIDEQADERSLS